MFAEIAAEQPDLQLPTEDQIGTGYRRTRRTKTRGMGVARDVGFRMPSVWLAEGHSAVAPVYLYRFDWATPMLKATADSARAHATELPYVWGNLVAGPEGPHVQARRVEDRQGGVGANAGPLAKLRHSGASRSGCPANRSGCRTTRPIGHA